jgi:PTS system nitrogen regulatory IIA component
VGRFCFAGNKPQILCKLCCRFATSPATPDLEGLGFVIIHGEIPIIRFPSASGHPTVQSLTRRISTMNRLAAILPAGNVLVSVDASSKKRAFEHAGLLFENRHAIARATVTDNLFARERLGSTGLGHGVAIPHGRIKGLKNPLAAVLRVQQPIPFEAPDDEPVTLLIFLLVPEAATQRHLEILSEIAELLSDRELREQLKVEEDPVRVHEMISRWEPLKSVA